MITNIRIENFKPLKKINTSIKSLNLLVGLNGMGKTSFIQALLLLLQSDKLENRIISLNGALAEIGQGRDALYQFAQDDYILFNITIDETKEYSWKFGYKKDKEELVAETGYTKADIKFFKEQTQHFRYINANRIGPQNLYEASSMDVEDKEQLGLQGENTPYFIDIYGNDYRVPLTLQHPNATADTLLAQINAWLKVISPGVSLNTKYVPDAYEVILDYRFDFGKEKTHSFRPKNVGFGISYVLPILVALLAAKKGQIIVIENPESHIHPRGQAEMGKLIALAARSGAQLFIETHSDHILNGIRVAVKEKLIGKDNTNILFFDKKTTDNEQFAYVTPIQIDENGSLSEYPQNFLDEWSNQLSKLI